MSDPKQQTQNVYHMEQAVSVNGYFDVEIDGEHQRVQVTARNGADAARVFSVVEVYIEGIRLLRQKYPQTEIVKEAQSNAPGPDSKKPYTPKPVPQNELPEELQFEPSEGGPVEVFKDEFDYFILEPQPDEKATVKFYKDKLEFPVGAAINKWKNANVAQALAALGDIDPTKPLKMRVAGVQFWVKGNSYVVAKGKYQGQTSHYKNLKLIQATL